MPSVPKSSPSPLLFWAALLVVYLVWGSTYLGIAVAIETIPPFLMATIRFVVAGSLLLAWDWRRGGPTRALPTAVQLRDSFIVGALLLAFANGFVGLGERTVPSGIAAIMIALVPVWIAVLGWLYFRDRLPALAAIAVVIGFGGVALLVWPAGAGANQFDPFGILILAIAPISWAHGTLFAARRANLPSRPLMASGLQMLGGAAVLLVLSAVTGELGAFDPAKLSPRSILAVGYLVAFGSMVAFTAYGWLVRHGPLSIVATYAYVNPIVAVALGALILAEPISPRTIVASAIVLVAVAIIITTRGRQARAAARRPVAAETSEVRATTPRPAPSGRPAAPSS
jgi:drug/metabolite transporter (DMT)-like permease